MGRLGQSAFLCFWQSASIFGTTAIKLAKRAQNNQAAATAYRRLSSQCRHRRELVRILGPGRCPLSPSPLRRLRSNRASCSARSICRRPGLRQPGHSGKLWLYLPSGQHAARSLPCILIAGAGSNLITGMDLGDGDRAEHLPHVRAGSAVLAYELDGALPENSNENTQALARSSTAFLNAQAGLINARVAIEYAATQVPSIDPKRLFTVGHSSAGTVALLVAENEPRIAGCVAFAPAVDVKANFPPEAQQAIAQIVPGADQFFTRFNPRVNESKIACPLFLFYANDDARFASQVRELGARLQASGKQVTVSSVTSGGHYDSMINVGVPRAIEWLKSLPAPGPSEAPCRDLVVTLAIAAVCSVGATMAVLDGSCRANTRGAQACWQQHAFSTVRHSGGRPSRHGRTTPTHRGTVPPAGDRTRPSAGLRRQTRPERRESGAKTGCLGVPSSHSIARNWTAALTPPKAARRIANDRRRPP